MNTQGEAASPDPAAPLDSAPPPAMAPSPDNPPDAPALIPAATLLLVRDGAAGLDVLLVKRADDLRNFRGMWVFPGGRIDAADREGAPDIRAAAVNAAIRETREEAGLHIPAKDLLHLSRWTAPEGAPKRFDTWFFVGIAGDEQAVVVDGAEIRDHRWLSPAAALEEYSAGELKLMPPTYVSLLELAKHPTAAALRQALAGAEPFHFTPKVCAVGDALHFLYPGDAGYAAQNPETPGPRHRCILSGGELTDGRRLSYLRD